MIFEKANHDDINELVDLRMEYLSEDYGKVSQEKLDRIYENLPSYFRDHLNESVIVFFCRDEDMIAGCCILYISQPPSNPSFVNGRIGIVLNVYTRPQYRKKGIARKLLEMLLAESEKLDLDYVELKSTDEGYNLYLSLGFEDVVSRYHNMKYITGQHSRA